MKEQIIRKCIEKKMKWKEGSEILGMHPKALSRLKRNYLTGGLDALVGKKPGPKKGHAWNKTPEFVEKRVEGVALEHPEMGPDGLAEELKKRRVYVHPVTVWRILKRNKVRYTQQYRRWKLEPKLYCLEEPGEELQMDACYPYGRAKKVASFDAADDCSRFVYGKCYDRETAENAMKFVEELLRHVPFRVQRLRVDNRYGKTFKTFCEGKGIEVIENEPYSPEQNGKIERFHGTLKRNFFYRECSFNDDMESLNYKYNRWLQYYNYERKHTGLGMNKLTPAQKIALCYLKSIANVYLENKKVTLFLQQNKN